MRAERLHQLTIAGNVANAAFYAATGSGMHSDIITIYQEELSRIHTGAYVVLNIGVAAIYGTLLALESLREQPPEQDMHSPPLPH